MASIEYTADDGSAVPFLDPAGVAQAVAAALAAQTPATGEVIKDEVVENTDGTSETLVPESALPEAESPAEDATETTEEAPAA